MRPCGRVLSRRTNLSFMAEEMIDPQRQLPRAIIGGMLLVVAVYLCCNLCYLAVLPAFVSTATVPSLALGLAHSAPNFGLDAGIRCC